MDLETQGMGKNHRSGLWAFAFLFVLYLVGNVLVGIFLFETMGLYHQLIDVLIPSLLYLLVTRQPVLSTLKLNKGLSSKAMWRIFQLFLASFLVKYGVNYLLSAVGNIDAGEVTMEIFQLVPDLMTFFITVAVIPVLLEEVFIRGIVLDHFRDVNLLQASVATGILFGIMHVDIGQFGYATALGIVMAAVVLITGSLWAGIWFHFLNNFFSFAVLGGLKELSERYPDLIQLEEMIMDPAPVELALADRLTFVVVALVVLYLGVRLTLRYIKKMRKEHDYQDVESKVSWGKLFFNIPMGVILLLYLSIHLFLRG